MKVAVVTTIGSLDDTRTSRLVRTLTEAGFEIAAITCPPRSPGCSQDGVTFIPLPVVSRNFWYNSSFLDICMAILMRLRNSVIAFWALLRQHPEVCHCQEPDSWLIGVLVKLFTGASIVVDIREVYEERSLAFPMILQPMVRRLIKMAMKALSKMTDYIIHVSETRQLYYSYLTAPSVVISNYPPLEEFSQKECARPPELQGKFVVIHAGALRLNYAARELLLAVQQASLEVDNLILIVIGGVVGPAHAYTSLLEELGREGKLVILPHMSHRDVIRYLSISDVGVSLVLPIDKIHQMAFPLKLFEYMAAGLPIIGCNVPDVERILRQEACGLIVDPYSPDSIAKAIVVLAKDKQLRHWMAENARQGAQRYQWATEASKLLQLYSHLATKPKLRRETVESHLPSSKKQRR
jgi:glycosyltransferase involved in cell wall biosynthesis